MRVLALLALFACTGTPAIQENPDAETWSATGTWPALAVFVQSDRQQEVAQVCAERTGPGAVALSVLTDAVVMVRAGDGRVCVEDVPLAADFAMLVTVTSREVGALSVWGSAECLDCLTIVRCDDPAAPDVCAL